MTLTQARRFGPSRVARVAPASLACRQNVAASFSPGQRRCRRKPAVLTRRQNVAAVAHHRCSFYRGFRRNILKIWWSSKTATGWPSSQSARGCSAWHDLIFTDSDVDFGFVARWGFGDSGARMNMTARFGIHMKNCTILSEIHRNRSYPDPFRAGGPRGWGIAKACCKAHEQAIEPVARCEYQAVST